MKLITLYLPETYIKILDELVNEKFYPNRAEAIRVAIKDLVVGHNKFHIKTDYLPPEPHVLTAIERLEQLQSRRKPFNMSEKKQVNP